MAFVTEVDSKLVGMYFRLRKAIQGAANGGFSHASLDGGAMITHARRSRGGRRPADP